MNHFEELVGEQLKTMDKLLFIQSEIERCQQIEAELQSLQKETELQSIQEEITKMKVELQMIHEMFERQTEEVVKTYQDKVQPIA
ncbi:YgaB family protein [Litchfieldia alkalitelluris]|uniref:YgaB family protein n=1 Tax=Litchfieldia alkalitelluris TaxID=304268 RepID=UPI000997C9E5|nr:YgaB family protein [Litchfieldia alkalitelluris]